MNRQQATDYVIRELGKHHQRNDIIQRLCEEGYIPFFLNFPIPYLSNIAYYFMGHVGNNSPHLEQLVLLSQI